MILILEKFKIRLCSNVFLRKCRNKQQNIHARAFTHSHTNFRYGKIIPDSNPKRFRQGHTPAWDGLSAWTRLQTVVHALKCVDKNKFPVFFSPTNACSSPCSPRDCFDTVLKHSLQPRAQGITLHRIWSFIDCMYVITAHLRFKNVVCLKLAAGTQVLTIT